MAQNQMIDEPWNLITKEKTKRNQQWNQKYNNVCQTSNEKELKIRNSSK